MTVQSTNLSSLSPKLMVYNSSLGLVGQASAVNSMGATVSVSTSVAANQGYYIKVLAARGYGAIGSYGLLVNAGSQSQAADSSAQYIVAPAARSERRLDHQRRHANRRRMTALAAARHGPHDHR